jgi:hypothetical protein
MAKIIVLLTAIVCALAATGTSSAATGVSGTYTVTDLGAFTCVPLGARQLRCDITGFTSLYEGSMTGTSTVSFVQFVDCARSRTHGQGIETFVGSVAGVGSGTLTWQISFQSDFDCNTFTASGFDGKGAITGSTGGLAGTHGLINFSEVDYSGDLH